jgi:pyruvate dehydrogenase (quinone)
VYVELVSVSEQMPRLLEIAIRSALSQRGTAVLVVRGEVFLEQATGPAEGRAILPTSSAIRPDDAALAAAVDVLNAANRVTILAGAGSEGAHDEPISPSETLPTAPSTRANPSLPRAAAPRQVRPFLVQPPHEFFRGK